jgi:hypothetical protein
MKFSTLASFTVSALVVSSGALADIKRPGEKSEGLSKYIVVFEKGLETPDRIVKAAEERLKSIGAYITYEYNTVLKGFAVTAPADVMNAFAVQDNNAEYPFIIETDKQVCK